MLTTVKKATGNRNKKIALGLGVVVLFVLIGITVWLLWPSKAKKSPGDTCTDAAECTTNYCNSTNKCATATKGKKEPGDTCTDSAECTTNYCNSTNKCATATTDNKEPEITCTDLAKCDLFLYGPYTSGKIRVQRVLTLADGRTVVYAAEEKGYIKMVSSAKYSKYYKGLISTFDESVWASAVPIVNLSGGPAYILSTTATEGEKEPGDTCTDSEECKTRYCNSTNKCATETTGNKEPEITCTDLAKCGLFLYGPYITGKISVQRMLTLADGKTVVYAAEEMGYVKMVSSAKNSKYYKGLVSTFDESTWTSAAPIVNLSGGPAYILSTTE